MHTIINKIILLILSIAFAANAMAQDTLSVKPVEDSVAIVQEDSVAMPTEESWAVADSLPWPQNLQARLDTIVSKAKILETSVMGLMVYDLTTDSVLFTHDARQTLRPASTMKLVTAITALDKLGADYEYKTRLGYTGDVIDSLRTLRGDIFIIGGMDPKISKDDLRLFADTIRALGIDTIRGNLYADKSFKDADMYGEGWCWDDDNSMLSALVYKRKDNLMDIFRDVLKEKHITFLGDIHDGVKPKGLHHIMDLTRPLTDVLKPMMKKSNNLYAESMLYQIGATQGLPSTAKKALKVEEALLKKIEQSSPLPLNERGRGWIYRFADGSGLSLYDYLSAEIEVAYLRYAYHHEKIYEPLYDSLPIAGVDGTISDRMRGTSAQGNIHAKTGTVSGISSLAGYCTAKNGHLLAFAIINQNVMKGIYAKRLQDRICIAMTK